jgi:hypothetical protein
VVVLKVLHLCLLLWAPEQHARWRKPLLWVERALRTLVTARLVAHRCASAAAAGSQPVLRGVRRR